MKLIIFKMKAFASIVLAAACTTTAFAKPTTANFSCRTSDANGAMMWWTRSQVTNRAEVGPYEYYGAMTGLPSSASFSTVLLDSCASKRVLKSLNAAMTNQDGFGRVKERVEKTVAGVGAV